MTAAKQRILFTVTTRAVSLGAGTLPLSIHVSPRLYAETTLGAFPDWETWTERIEDHGLELELVCGPNTHTVTVPPKPLRPDLWAALFDSETLVRSHEFDDYSGRSVLSYSVRDTIGALKSIYKQAAIALALPGAMGTHGREDVGRRYLRNLLDGLAVHWSEREGEHLRAQIRDTQPRSLYSPAFPRADQLDAEGYPTGPVTAARNASVALPFAVFHHMPTPPGTSRSHPISTRCSTSTRPSLR